MSTADLPVPRLAPRAVRRALIAASAIGAAAVALLAFAMSFDALTQLARGAGIRPVIAWMWPVVVDGSMIVATAAALVLRTSPAPAARFYPWAQLALFGLVSVVGNGLHASGATDLPGLVAVAVSGIPPVALLLSTHLLVMMLPRWRWSADEETGTGAIDPGAGGDDPVASTVVRERPALPTVEEPAPQALAPPTPADTAGEDDPVGLVAWIREREAAGESISGRMVADHLDVSLSTGKRRLRAARERLEEGQ